LFLAAKEMLRAKARFAMLIAAIALLVFLILFQQTLQNGLITSFVGAIEHQSAPVLVYSTDGRRNLQSSSITPEVEQQVLAVPGVGRSGALGQSTVSVRADRTVTGAALIGYEKVRLGAPSSLVAGRFPTGSGEGIANESDADAGFDLGDVVRVQPGGYAIRIVGQARDVNLQATPTIFMPFPTFEDAARSANPDARDIRPNALALAPAAGVSDAELVRRVNAVSPDVEALTRSDAAAKAPGVSQVRTSFLLIFLLYGLVVPLVTGLFFLIITFQKANSLTLLRAIGASGWRLVQSLLVQVLIVIGLGIIVGTALYAPVSFQRIGSIPLRFETTAVFLWAAVLLGLGLLSSLFAARRVLAIDPIEATTGAGVHV
jgi:putative ABC transport system permease protein